MAIYIDGHGVSCPGTVYIPSTVKLGFFVVGQGSADTKVTLKTLAEGDEITMPVEYSDVTIDNLQLLANSSQERAWAAAMVKEGLRVRFIGDDRPVGSSHVAPALSSGIYLCGRMGKGECDEVHVRRNGHTCNGLMGILRDESEIKMLTCRSPGYFGGNGKQPYVPEEAKAYFTDVTDDVRRFRALIKSDPEEAWRQVQELGEYRKPVATEGVDHAEEHGKAVGRQERLIMMMTSSTAIGNWIHSYGARHYFFEHGHFTLARMVLAQEESTVYYKDEIVRDALDWVGKYLEWLEARVESGEYSAFLKEWEQLSEHERREIIAIDEYRSGILSTHLHPENAHHPGVSVRWEEVDRQNIQNLKSLRTGDEHVWMMFAGDGRALVSVVSEDAIEHDDSPLRLGSALKALEEDALGMIAFRCIGVDGSIITMEARDEQDNDSLWSGDDLVPDEAVKRINGFGEVTVVINKPSIDNS